MPSSKKKNKEVKAKKNAAGKNVEEEAFLEEAIKLAAAEEIKLKDAVPASKASAAASSDGTKEDSGQKKIVFTTPSEYVDFQKAIDSFGNEVKDAVEGNFHTTNTFVVRGKKYELTQGEMYSRSQGMPSTASMVKLLKNPLFRSLCDAKNIDVSSGSKEDPHEMSLERQLKELQLHHQEGSFEAEDQCKCVHGWCPWVDKEEKMGCKKLCDDFLNAAVEASDANMGDFIDKFAYGMRASQMKRIEVWGEMKKLEKIKTYFLSIGTTKLCKGVDGEDVAVCAYFARFFEHYIECYEERKPMRAAKTYELLFLDHRTIVSFFKNRIECNCLDAEYDKVKDMPKMGICANIHCKLPRRRVERSKLHCCSKCRQRDYCSRACQKADWSCHKKLCGKSKEFLEKELQKYREQNKVSEGVAVHVVQVSL